MSIDPKKTQPNVVWYHVQRIKARFASYMKWMVAAACFCGLPSTLLAQNTFIPIPYQGNLSDYSTIFNQALLDCKAGHGGIILFGKGTFTFTQGVTVDAPGCSIQGAGQRATTLVYNASAGNLITLAEYGNTVSELGFGNKTVGGNPVWTSGYAVAVGGGVGASLSILRDLYFEGVPGAVHVYNSTETRIENLQIFNPIGVNAGVMQCDDNGTVGHDVYAVRMSNIAIGYANNNSQIDSFVIARGCNTATINNSSVSGGMPSGRNCIVVRDTAQFVALNDFECDHSAFGALFDGGSVIQSINGFYGSTLQGNGITFSPNFVGNAQFTNNDVRGNWFHGVLLNGGADVVFSGGVIGNNSQAATGSYNGFTVGAGVSRFTITGIRSGAITQINGSPSPSQGYGICVTQGSSTQYVIVGNNLVGNTIGGLGDCGTCTNKVVGMNLQ